MVYVKGEVINIIRQQHKTQQFIDDDKPLALINKQLTNCQNDDTASSDGLNALRHLLTDDTARTCKATPQNLRHRDDVKLTRNPNKFENVTSNQSMRDRLAAGVLAAQKSAELRYGLTRKRHRAHPYSLDKSEAVDTLDSDLYTTPGSHEPAKSQLIPKLAENTNPEEIVKCLSKNTKPEKNVKCLSKNTKPEKNVKCLSEDTNHLNSSVCGLISSKNSKSSSKDEMELRHLRLKNKIVNSINDMPIDNQINEDQPKDEESTIRRTVFVGNVPLGVKREQLIRALGLQPTDCEKVYYRNIGVDRKFTNHKREGILSKSYSGCHDAHNAYIQLTSDELVKSVLHKNATKLGDSILHVDRVTNANKFSKYKKSKTVYISGLPYTANENDIYNVMGHFGVIKSWRLIRDGTTGKSKRFGFVMFETRDSAKAARRFDNRLKIVGSPIRIQVPISAEEAEKRRDAQNKRILRKKGQTKTKNGFSARTKKAKNIQVSEAEKKPTRLSTKKRKTTKT